MGDNLDDTSVAQLEALAERRADDVASPALREAVDVGELVHHTGRDQNPTSDDVATADELDPEVVVIGAGRTTRADLRASRRHSSGPRR